MQNSHDIAFTLRFDRIPKGIVYLSVSWQPDDGKDFGYRLIQKIDKENYLAIGDAKGFDDMDSARLKRIMYQAGAFLSLLPYRPDKPCKTSGFMLDELELAIEIGLPIGILYDTRVALSISDKADESPIVITMADGKNVAIPRERMIMLSSFDFGVKKSEELQLIELPDFLLKTTIPQSKISPYSFLISRLKPDFRLPREACLAAAESGSGVPCYWIESKDYKCNIDDTIERARLLIKNATFVVAEISLTDENPDFDNPSRAHEIGLATAYGKVVIPVSHDPRRHPYHGLVTQQLVWWENEEELFENLKAAVYAERGSIGRHIYNWELEGLDGDQIQNFCKPRFVATRDRWHPPEENYFQGWIYAISFGVIVFSMALLLRHGVGYDDTLDLVAILAGLATFMFSSRINRTIHAVLIRIRYLKWLVPTIATILFAATVVFFRPARTNAAERRNLKENLQQVEEHQRSKPETTVDK